MSFYQQRPQQRLDQPAIIGQLGLLIDIVLIIIIDSDGATCFITADSFKAHAHINYVLTRY